MAKSRGPEFSEDDVANLLGKADAPVSVPPPPPEIAMGQAHTVKPFEKWGPTTGQRIHLPAAPPLPAPTSASEPADERPLDVLKEPRGLVRRSGLGDFLIGAAVFLGFIGFIAGMAVSEKLGGATAITVVVGAISLAVQIALVGHVVNVIEDLRWFAARRDVMLTEEYYKQDAKPGLTLGR